VLMVIVDLGLVGMAWLTLKVEMNDWCEAGCDPCEVWPWEMKKRGGVNDLYC
jgi:hypothetical protein